jgi:hypothetical protein
MILVRRRGEMTYQIQAVRSTSVGPWALFNVNFGVSSDGAITTSVTEWAPAKIARERWQMEDGKW